MNFKSNRKIMDSESGYAWDKGDYVVMSEKYATKFGDDLTEVKGELNEKKIKKEGGVIVKVVEPKKKNRKPIESK